MTRQTVLLVFGGESSEHEVSVSSARNIFAAMDGEKYDTKLCFIDTHGKWWLLDTWTENFERHGGVQLVAAPGSKSFMTVPGNSVLHIDVIFPALHGKNGEDGTVQGLAALLGVPIVGCDVTASAVCMDKAITKQILMASGIKTAKFHLHRRGEEIPTYQDMAKDLGEVFFVKPARAGSSVGVSKVHNAEEYMPAVKGALQHDDRVLIEEFIDGRELELAVLGNPPKHQVSGVGEIISGAEFYDYEDKYADTSGAQVLTNVEMSADLLAKLQDTASRTYAALGCRGLSRVDFRMKGNVPYVLEVNTMPGFTNISMYPKLWRASGMHYPELVDKLIQLAVKDS
jgi:D-alanine-D-alanine ligase